MDFLKRDFGSASDLVNHALLQLDVLNAALLANRVAEQNQTNLIDKIRSKETQSINNVLRQIGAARIVAARSFVFELSLFRQILLRIGEAEGSKNAAVTVCTDKLDSGVPGIVSIRDSLAHFDERILGRTRARKIGIEDTNFCSPFEWNIQNGKVTMIGSLGQAVSISITERTISSCEEALSEIICLFPAET